MQILRQHDVFDCGEIRDKVKLLKYESYLLGAKPGALGSTEPRKILAFNDDLAIRTRIEATKDVE